MRGLRSLLAAVAVFLSGYAAALEKVVPAGEVWRVAADEQQLHLTRLVLGDGAIVRFADGVSRWRLSAERVEIGNNVVIDGRGAAGEVGQDGAPPIPAVAAVCESGAAGAPGGEGARGASGVAMTLDWGIAAIGSLQLLTDGGAGGAGGRGGAGQAGGELNRCRGGDGGPGGPGGRGGMGGDAGALQLVYRPVDKRVDVAQIVSAITHSSAGGAGGSGGAGGPGGAAAEGRYMKGSIGGSKKWLAGGEPGGEGTAGAPGATGENGRAILQLDQAGASAKSLPQRDSGARVGRQDRVSVLEERIEALEKRLERLEQQRSH